MSEEDNVISLGRGHNAGIIERTRGVRPMPGTHESDADPRNPNIGMETSKMDKTVAITLDEYIDLHQRLAFAEGALAGIGERLGKASRLYKKDFDSAVFRACVDHTVRDINEEILPNLQLPTNEETDGNNGEKEARPQAEEAPQREPGKEPGEERETYPDPTQDRRQQRKTKPETRSIEDVLAR